MIAVLAVVAGFIGTGLQIFLQVWQARHLEMDNHLYWSLLLLGIALMAFGILYGLWRSLAALYNFMTKRKFTFDYAYGLALAGIHLGYDDSMNPPPVQLGLILANATEYPIKYEVEQFDVVIENRALEQRTFRTTGGVIPSRMSGTYFYPPFGKELPEGRDHLKGVIRFTILYGHPEAGFFRKLKKEITVSLRVGAKLSAVWLVEWESDEGIGR